MQWWPARPGCEFDLDGERRRGRTAGQISERSFSGAQLLVSVLVQYLNANDAGLGFYDLAARKRLLRRRPSQDVKLTFWVKRVNAVCATPGSSRFPAIG